jgi:hypothetical protein
MTTAEKIVRVPREADHPLQWGWIYQSIGLGGSDPETGRQASLVMVGLVFAGIVTRDGKGFFEIKSQSHRRRLKPECAADTIHDISNDSNPNNCSR